MKWESKNNMTTEKEIRNFNEIIIIISGLPLIGISIIIDHLYMKPEDSKILKNMTSSLKIHSYR
jgi:hypothetical protein